ncbi:MAG: short-chain dehydrogenase [Flammeovirgaceae bacterium]|nr:short-chain dehydrogenase [Flammeovirgaceae bacterium]|tara:strand:- start:1011 stop:1718 length:708 start_codon:yes stop_codon:yes gene_type:complete
MNKTIVITGGSKGIGKSIALKFAQENFDIYTCSRNQDDLLKLKNELNSLNQNITLYTLKCDLSTKDGCNGFINFINDNTKKIDILVNNVGTFIPGKLIEEDDSALEKMIDINLYSNYWITKGLIKLMTNYREGHIFNICSIASKVAYANGGSYCISKFALYGMSQCLREELKDFDVKVTAVLPGAVRTGSWDGTTLPDERFIIPDDVSNSIFSAYNTSKGATIEEIIIRPQLGDI